MRWKNKIKLMSLIMAIYIIASSFTFSSIVFAEDADSIQKGPLHILEVEPGPVTNISATIKVNLEEHYRRSVDVTTMAMPEFISKVEEVNGKYDIVYIGNKEYSGDSRQSVYAGNVYSQFGPSKIGGIDLPRNSYMNFLYDAYTGDKSKYKEFYSGNDISNLAADKLIRYVESKQLVIFDSGIFSNDMRSTKLYNKFITYRTGHINVRICTIDTLKDSFMAYGQEGISKRPYLKLKSKPIEYNGNNSVTGSSLLSFGLAANNMNATQPMKVKLYIDKNGDGLYKETEKVIEDDNVLNSINYSLSYNMPSTFSGLVAWKLELTDSLGAKAYETGDTAFSKGEVSINVLQLLLKSGITLHLTSLSNLSSGGQTLNLLKKDGEFNINITEMNISDFNNNYGNKVNNKETILNGNYDMVVFGFADSYCGDLDNTKGALNAIKNFAQTGQAIMFTHDTIGYKSGNSPVNLTNAFRDLLGLHPYKESIPLPAGIEATTGITRLDLYRAKGGVFITANKTYKMNESSLTKYPYVLGDIDVSTTHFQYLLLDVDDPDANVAYTYKNSNETDPNPYHKYDGANDYYTFFKNNLTFSGTGHSSINSIPEYKMFVNTMLKAYVGANHAPEVNIIGINDGDSIANTQSTLNFKVKATDYEDTSLTGKIIIDSNGDGYYTETPAVTFEGVNSLKSAVEKAVTLSKGVSDSVTEFGIKFVATDSDGAEGFKQIRIKNLPTPQLSLSNNAGNYLVGDTADVQLNVKATSTPLGAEYKNPVLNLSLDSNKFGNFAASGWTDNGGGNYTKVLNNVIFGNMTATPGSQTANISLKCLAPGSMVVPANLKFDGWNGDKTTVNGGLNINVKVGTVTVKARTVSNGSIDNRPVTLKGYKDSSFTTSNGIALNGTTDSTGNAVFSSIPTGYYKATIVLPDDYKAIDNSNVGNSLSGKIDSELCYADDTKTIELPKVYRIPVVTIDGTSVQMWKSIDLNATVDLVEYQCPQTQVTWTVTHLDGDAAIDPATGTLTGKRVGRVTVTADTHQTDAIGNSIKGSKEISITGVPVDIN